MLVANERLQMFMGIIEFVHKRCPADRALFAGDHGFAACSSASRTVCGVSTVGSTVLHYDARCIDDLHAMLKQAGDWVELGGADEPREGLEGEAALDHVAELARVAGPVVRAEEAREIRGLLHTSRPPLTEAQAAVQVLGVDYETLALGVGKAWGLPDTIQRCMRKPLGSPMQRAPEQGVERLRWAAMAANEVAGALLFSDPAQIEGQLGQVGTRYARTLALSAACAF